MINQTLQHKTKADQNAMNMLLNGIWPIVFAAIGWLAFQFIGQPVRNFFDLRRETKRQMLLYWDIPNIYSSWDFNPAAFEQPRTTFAELAAQFIAFDRSEWLAAWFVRLLNFDPTSAGNLLRSISIEFGTMQEEREKNFRLLDSALKFRYDKKRPFYNPYNPGL